MAERDIFINRAASIKLSEIELTAIRSQGPGGQNINKVASAIHLRFDIGRSSLSAAQKATVLAHKDRRLTASGVIVIKAQNHRTQERNKQEAISRLQDIMRTALHVRKYRRATKPSKGAIRRAQQGKTHRSALKSSRKKVGPGE